MLSGPLARFAVWLLVSLIFPLPTWNTTFCSFQLEVLHDITRRALPQERRVPERVMLRLEQFEARELNPHLRDDIRIAWITTLYASQGNPQSHVDATYRVLGLHPDKVWPAILARREALLGGDAWRMNACSADSSVTAIATTPEACRSLSTVPTWTETATTATASTSATSGKKLAKKPLARVIEFPSPSPRKKAA